MTKFPAAPPSLFNRESHIPFGIYDGLIRNTSTALWDKQSGLFSARRTSRKAWIFFGVYSPEFIGGLAIADAGFFTKIICIWCGCRSFGVVVNNLPAGRSLLSKLFHRYRSLQSFRNVDQSTLNDSFYLSPAATNH